MSTKDEAERLAARITSSIALYPEYSTAADAAALLRKLQAENEALRVKYQAREDEARDLSKQIIKLRGSHDKLVRGLDAAKADFKRQEEYSDSLQDRINVSEGVEGKWT
jgi:septal ring factor EnvC (AmiA/AmiB activator)